MFSLDRWNEIFEAIRKNKFRTFLTGVSVASGIFILVILLGTGNGMRNGINDAFAGDAINGFLIAPRRTTVDYKGLNKGRRIEFDMQDYNMVLQEIEPYIDKRSPVLIHRSAIIKYSEKNSGYRVNAIYPDFFTLENCQLSGGRFFHYGDVKKTKKVAVIGAVVKKELFGDKNPIGERILINDISFLVIGTYIDEGGNRDENRIYIPYSTGTYIFGRVNDSDQLAFTLKSQKNVTAYATIATKVFDIVKTLLKTKHIIAPEDDNAIRIHNALNEAKRIYTMMDVMKLFFWVVGICTIIAGVVGVSNIMFIIVRERTKEIGIRKALGAKPWSIIGMILHESVFLTTVSGFAGLILSLLLWEMVGPHIDSKFFKNPNVDFSTAVNAVIVLIISGTLAGFFPAYKAAKIKPIEALKDE